MKYRKFTIQYNVEKNDLGLSNMLTQKKIHFNYYMIRNDDCKSVNILYIALEYTV